MNTALMFAKELGRVVRVSALSRVGSFRSWPPRDLTLVEPLALATERTDRLRRIYAMALRDGWDGPTEFRNAVARHGGIQLAPDKREALAGLISMLMWGELAAWTISAELVERLDDADARMAASSQVFDEARHFYTLRDYLALLHVPVPPLDPYFATGVRLLLASRNLELKLAAMQLLAEGTAQTIFGFLGEARIEPVLSDLLPLIERDEARHIGLGVMHLPARLAKLSRRECLRIADRVQAIGDLFAITQFRYIDRYHALGLDPRELFRRADRMLFGLSRKLGNVPGTDCPYLLAPDPDAPGYEHHLEFVLPRDGRRSPAALVMMRAIDLGARLLPS